MTSKTTSCVYHAIGFCEMVHELVKLSEPKEGLSRLETATRNAQVSVATDILLDSVAMLRDCVERPELMPDAGSFIAAVRAGNWAEIRRQADIMSARLDAAADPRVAA